MKAVLILAAAVLSLGAADPEVGVLQHNGAFELSVIFQDPVDRASMLRLDNYQISPGTLLSLRETATNQGVILTASGLQTNMDGFLSVTGILDSAQSELPPSLLSFNTGQKFWVAIGDTEVPSAFAPEVTSFSTNGFDLFSSGIQQIDDYDETTFAGEKVTGDFDRITRVEWVDPAGAGAKAGIMVREDLDEGKPRPVDPFDPNQTFSRYIELAISAPTNANGSLGSGSHRIYRRANKGDLLTESLTVTNDAAPAFPNAWLRMRRDGNEFTMYRGTNGLQWQQIGSASFPSPATNALYIGVAFSPQNDDLPNNLKRAYVAKFRTFGGTNWVTMRLNIARLGTQAEVSWQGAGILQTVTTLPGQWQDAPDQANPQTVNPTNTARFFRLRSGN